MSEKNESLPFFIFLDQLSNKILTNPTELNPYLFANGNPLINTDTFGLNSNVTRWMKRLKSCKDCKDAIDNPEGDDWDAYTRCKKCCKGLQPRTVFSVTPCEQACVKLWKEKHGK